MGKPLDPHYWSTWRANHPEYRERERAAALVRAGRRAAQNEWVRPSRATPPLEPLYGHLLRGARISFWEDELRIDLEQERALAVLEGRDPDLAAQTYRRRELAWRAHIAPLLPERWAD